MRKFLCFSSLLISLSTATFLAPGTASARSGGKIGAGIVLGEPSGLTGKFWLGQRAALDAGLAFSLNNFILVYADYLHHWHGLFGRSNQVVSQLSVYLGAGGVLGVVSNTGNAKGPFAGGTTGFGVGARVPVGLEWAPSDPPIGVFLELVPGLSILPGVAAMVQGGIGIRYYF